MIALIQRVSQASVRVDATTVGAIDNGLLVLLGVQREDDEKRAERLLEKILAYRVFSDDAGRMNRSVRETGGGMLVVSQFTLAADTRKGTRPSFTGAGEPARAKELYEHFIALARAHHPVVETGRFAADMQVSLVNDGPVTFWLES